MSNVIYRVQAPDGSILKIEGPEGASEQDLIGAAKQHYEAQKPKPAAKPATMPASPLINGGALLDTAKDLPRYGLDALRSFGMGALDLAVGAGQLASQFMGDERKNRYADAMRSLEQDYQAGRASQETPDVGRLTGTITAGGLLGRAAPAATLPGRMLQGATTGGILGAMSPVDPAPEPSLTQLVTGEAQQRPSFATQKAVQIGGGAIVGGVTPAVVEGVVRGVGFVANKVADAARGLKNSVTGAANAGNIEAQLSEQFDKAGLAWSRLPKDFREVVINETQKAIRTGGTLDDGSAKRLADFVRLKIQPTQGQLSRNPQQFANELNLRATDAGQPIAERLSEQNRQLIGAVDQLRQGTGARTGDAYSAGQRVMSDLRATDAAAKGRVDAAYTQARSLAGMDSEVPAQPVADKLGRIVEDFGDDNIPGAVAKRLQQFGFMGGKQTKLLTVREAEKLKTLIGNNIDNPNTPSGKALTQLKGAIDDAMNSIGDDAGAEAAGAFQQARGLAAQRFSALRRTPGLEKAISQDPGAPEKFIEQQIIRGEVKDVANLMFRLKPDARAEVRAAVLDWIKGRGVTGVEDAAKFSQSGFNRALQSLGERKLNLIFAGDKEAVAQLQALGRVGAYVQAPPVGSAVNTSNTLTAGLGYADQASRLPLIGWMFGKPSEMVRAAQAANAVGPVAPVAPASPFIAPALVNQLATQGGLLGGYAGALAPAMLLENKGRKQAKKGAAK